jgi:hypothetical protein
MPKTSAHLKMAIAGYLQRDPSIFVRGTGDSQVDLLLIACNNARLYTERKIDFVYSVVEAVVPNCSLAEGGNLDDAVAMQDNSAPVSVKKIRTPFLPLCEGSYFPVDLWTKKKWNDRLKSRFDGARPHDTARYAYITDAPFVVVQDGKRIFVAPPDSSLWTNGTLSVALDVFAWLPDYVTGEENDFLLDYCFDWLMYRSIYELNFFLKEDERVSVSERLMADAWDAVVKWNNELQEANVDDNNLD